MSSETSQQQSYGLKESGHNCTIVAVASPNGKGAVSVIRLSGPLSGQIFLQISQKKELPQPRKAVYCTFYNEQGQAIDLGLAIYFPAPNSFTGEDIIEFQGHGGQVVVSLLLNRIIQLGAKIAEPGEFSKRAFLNDKIDLTQAEAIADLIDSSSQKAAQSALRSLQGQFSQQINQITEQIISFRMYVEAAIDFPEEEIDFLADDKVNQELTSIVDNLKKIIEQTEQGVQLKEGITTVIIGKPNAGKSSLLNQLSQRESAIVTHIPGTTRDLIREQILIDGVAINLVDTAGLRNSEDPVEQEGIRRAHDQISLCDLILLVVDASETFPFPQQLVKQYEVDPKKTIIIYNKVDLISELKQPIFEQDEVVSVCLSAKTGMGMDVLRKVISHKSLPNQDCETPFIARRRHLDALNKAFEHISLAKNKFYQYKMGELLAEDLRVVQDYLSEITGKFMADDLLGRIFSSFCIGK